VAGNLALGAQALGRVRDALDARFRSNRGGPAELARQLVHTRTRLEKEGTGPRAKGEFKKLGGGYYDVEYLLAYLLLTRAPHWMEPAHPLRPIAALEAAGVLDTADARTLRSAAWLYRALDHALRVVTGRPVHRLPDPGLAGRVTSLLHQWGIPLEGTLEAAVARARQQTRALYERIVVAAAEKPSG
jgi:glutamine synthetase adenylyltransferase